MFGLTYSEGSTVLGACLAVGVAVLDASVMHAFGVQYDTGLIGLGIGGLLGTAIPRFASAVR